MKVYHSYFSYWLNFKNKRDYCFIAISRTYPQYFKGCIFPKLAPPKDLFLNTCEHYDRNVFFPKYANYLKSLNKKEILNEIYSFSKFLLFYACSKLFKMFLFVFGFPFKF